MFVMNPEGRKNKDTRDRAQWGKGALGAWRMDVGRGGRIAALEASSSTDVDSGLRACME